MASIESRSSLAVRVLAQMLLQIEGESLPPTKSLADQAGVGVATVAKALDFLSDNGAVKVVRVQRYGTTIVHLDRGRLWAYAGYGPVRCILPMALSTAMQALAIATTSALEAEGIEVSLTYQAGARIRLEALEAGKADCTLISQHGLSRLPGVKHVHEFPPDSYYGSTGIYRLFRRDVEQVERVGADIESPDHYDLVQAEFPASTIINTPFHRIPRLLATGKLDASVWYGGSAVPGEYINQLRSEPAVSPEAEKLKQSPAVLVTTTRSPACNLLLSLDADTLDRTYEQVANADSGDLL
jgi:hypothetical protein